MRIISIPAFVLLAGLVAGACDNSPDADRAASPRATGPRASATPPPAGPSAEKSASIAPVPGITSAAKRLAPALLQPADLPAESPVKAITPQTIDIQDQVRSSLSDEQLMAQKGVHLESAELSARQAASCGNWAVAGWPDLKRLDGLARIYAETPFPFSSSLVGSTVVAGPRPADLDRVRAAVARCASLDVTLTKYKVRGKVTQRVVALPDRFGDAALAIVQTGTWPANLPKAARPATDLFTGDVVFMNRGRATVIVYVAGKAGVTARQLAAPAFDRAAETLG